MRTYFFYAFFGLAMGATLSMAGLTDYAQIHSLFILENIPLLLVFASAISMNMVGFLLLSRKKKTPKKQLTKGTVSGSILFGLGWALTGACPSIALVQLGEGKIAALATVAGILAGVWFFRRATSSTLKFDTGICGEE